MELKILTKMKQFKKIKEGDFLAVTWKLNSYYQDKVTRFGVYSVVKNKEHQKEIILQKKHNVYFNYDMFCHPEVGISNAKTVILIKGDSNGD